MDELKPQPLPRHAEQELDSEAVTELKRAINELLWVSGPGSLTLDEADNIAAHILVCIIRGEVMESVTDDENMIIDLLTQLRAAEDTLAGKAAEIVRLRVELAEKGDISCGCLFDGNRCLKCEREEMRP